MPTGTLDATFGLYSTCQGHTDRLLRRLGGSWNLDVAIGTGGRPGRIG